ncbi:MAG: UDP-N-acetylmuramate dehydrogenase [Oribacterium sp.]
MRRHTSFRAGGEAEYFFIPETGEELTGLIRRFSERGERFHILGNGTNLLVSDKGLRDPVISLRGLSELRFLGEDPDCPGSFLLFAEAGCLLSRLSDLAESFSLSGMEALRGIPGTVGGAVVMNAGAYGTEIRDILSRASLLDAAGEPVTLSAAELELSYRHSIVEERGYTVLSALFCLSKGDPGKIRALSEEFRRKRSEKQPLNLPSAGSTFQRPEGDFAGRLIEEAGLRGFRIGGAQVSEKHCGFIVNRGNATAAEIHALISEVIRRVKESSGVLLKPEVKMWGSF